MIGDGICAICGAWTNGSNIGSTCRKVYDRAIFWVLREHENERKAYEALESAPIVEKLKKLYDERMAKHGGNTQKAFRSSFRRSFIPSVLEQWSEKGFLSEKQRDIAKEIAFDGEGLPAALETKIRETQRAFLGAFGDTFRAEITVKARKLYKSV